MPSSSTKRSFLRGVRTGAPFALVVIPFATVFGVVAAEAGFNIAQVIGFSVLMFAGAAQLTVVQLMSEQAPTIVVIASALAVNLRVAMYSAALASHLGAAPLWQRMFVGYLNVDQSYALSIQEYETRAGMSVSDKVAFFFGSMTLILPVWHTASFVGAVVGNAIPPEYSLEFAVPIMFLAMVGPALRTLAHVAAAFTSVTVAILLAGLPYNLWLLAAAIAGMVAGVQVEKWMEARHGTSI
ncbi:MAG: putative branched-subunit amino acid permease [Paracoccaceae bacterium]|jgi:predicted branched-subunit amino acid permease